ncbi:hypothetical protein Q1695_014357 [Nippostrongylus brasiliensis]|nr:hypothetical protein Q1695_014357 [Nippostrongylus brasiliensis]
MSSPIDSGPPVQEEIVSISREDFEELCRLASPAAGTAPDPSLSSAASSSVKQSFEHPDKVVLKKVLSILTQKNELLVVADKDPDISGFYKKAKAESLKLSNPIPADYFKEKKENKRVVVNVGA